MDDGQAIALALAEAKAAGERGEVPVGAVLLSPTGILLARDGNRILQRKDPTAHAELEVIRVAAASLCNERLTGTTLYVSLEPCAMCAGAIAMARVKRVVFAAEDPKGGAILHGPKFFEQPTCHHHPEIGRAGDPVAAGAILKEFFKARRGALKPGQNEAGKPVHQHDAGTDEADPGADEDIAEKMGGEQSAGQRQP
jgi:tRNA(Arg) A34 adenosine deaminase TadA